MYMVTERIKDDDQGVENQQHLEQNERDNEIVNDQCSKSLVYFEVSVPGQGDVEGDCRETDDEDAERVGREVGEDDLLIGRLPLLQPQQTYSHHVRNDPSYDENQHAYSPNDCVHLRDVSLKIFDLDRKK